MTSILKNFNKSTKNNILTLINGNNLEQNKVHKICKFRKISTSKGEFNMITLEDPRYYWACSGLQTKLNNDDKMPKYHVSLGKKQCCKNSNMFWSFQVIDAWTFMQPSMANLNSPSSRIVKDATPFRRRILRCINFGNSESSPNNFLNVVNLYLIKFKEMWILNERAFFFFFFFIISFIWKWIFT